MNNKKREIWLDILKGIAILLVIIGHGPTISNRLYEFIWAFHMPLFFLISGYTFKKKEEKKFIKDKAKRLLIPYYFTCILLIASNIIYNIYYKSFSFNRLLLILKRWIWAGIYGSCWSYNNPFKIYDIGAIWFLCTLFAALLLFNFIMNTKEEYQPFIIVILVYIGLSLNQFFWLPFNFASACTSTLLLYVGYLSKKFDILNNKSLILKLLLFIISAVCIYNKSMVIIGNNTYSYGVFSILGAIAISYWIAKFSKQLEKTKYVSKFLSYLGRNTLVILCFHLIELDYIKWENIISFNNLYINCIIIYILKILWALFFIKLVDKTFLKRIYK